MRVGLVGLGLMGMPMARRLSESGLDLTVTSRRRPADEVPGRWADSAAELRDRDVVVTMLPAGADVQSAVEVLLSGARPSVVVDMSTIGPDWARRIAARCAEEGVGFVDAPVSGGPGGAASGTLTIMAGGSAEHVAAALPALEPLGAVHHLGGVGAGQSVKLINQVMLAGIMAGIADGFALAGAVGLDVTQVHAAVGGGMAGGRLLAFAGPRLARDDLEPGFTIAHFVKDLDLALAEADSLDLPLDLTTRVRDAYASLLPGLADRGTQALIRYHTKGNP